MNICKICHEKTNFHIKITDPMFVARTPNNIVEPYFICLPCFDLWKSSETDKLIKRMAMKFEVY